MTESEDDMIIFNSDVGTICASGPGLNKNNLTGLSFRSNLLSSTMNAPSHQSAFMRKQSDLRSMYHREKVQSPKSVRSAFSRQSYKQIRSASPMSVQSCCTNTSVNSVHFLNFLKYEQFNDEEFQMFVNVFKKRLKERSRKRFEKRRNRNLFVKELRRKRGYDSGEMASDSSNGCADEEEYPKHIPPESKLLPYNPLNGNIGNEVLPLQHNNEHVNKQKSIYPKPHEFLQSRTENAITEEHIFSIPQKSLHNANRKRIPRQENILYTPPKSKHKIHEDICLQEDKISPQSHLENIQEESREKLENNKSKDAETSCNGTFTLKDRFKRGFLLPSLRFNTSKLENNNNSKFVQNKSESSQQKKVNINSSDEDIFPPNQSSALGGNSSQVKRKLQGNSCAVNKKQKLLDSPKPIQKEKHNSSSPNIFKKPILPLCKSKSKHVEKEVLISKSSEPLDPSSNCLEAHENESQNNEISEVSNVSMKPSFIKRKLYSQKLELLSVKGSGSDSGGPSPQVKTNKEKNKARKLATSQSCLNRDVLNDENTVLDLIHKLVPAEQINSTTASKKSNKTADDNWDVTSVVSMCNSDNASVTFTDEETIFGVPKTVESNEKTQTEDKIKDCRVVINKINNTTNVYNKPSTSKINTAQCVKSFWDTDLESDMEAENIPRWVIKKPTSITNNKEVTSNAKSTKPPKYKFPILSVNKFYNKKNNNKKESHDEDEEIRENYSNESPEANIAQVKYNSIQRKSQPEVFTFGKNSNNNVKTAGDSNKKTVKNTGTKKNNPASEIVTEDSKKKKENSTMKSDTCEALSKDHNKNNLATNEKTVKSNTVNNLKNIKKLKESGKSDMKIQKGNIKKVQTKKPESNVRKRSSTRNTKGKNLNCSGCDIAEESKENIKPATNNNEAVKTPYKSKLELVESFNTSDLTITNQSLRSRKRKKTTVNTDQEIESTDKKNNPVLKSKDLSLMSENSFNISSSSLRPRKKNLDKSKSSNESKRIKGG